MIDGAFGALVVGTTVVVGANVVVDLWVVVVVVSTAADDPPPPHAASEPTMTITRVSNTDFFNNVSA
jgi:hypothetical protein